MSNIKHYRGIDFSVDPANWGECYLSVDTSSKTMTASLTPPASIPTDQVRNLPTSLDCPFGTTEGFNALLRGEKPLACEWDEGFKTRHTEKWVREELKRYATNQRWERLRDTGGGVYFHQSSHVQSSVGLVIVPGFLNWFLCLEERPASELIEARLGKGKIVESHPRLFLYSIIERIYLDLDPATRCDVEWKSLLHNTARYKGANRSGRRLVADFLVSNARHWLWSDFRLTTLSDEILATDHFFDAFLAALTSFAHDHRQTIGWGEVDELSEAIVKIEGHILVLRQTNTTGNQHQVKQL